MDYFMETYKFQSNKFFVLFKMHMSPCSFSFFVLFSFFYL